MYYSERLYLDEVRKKGGKTATRYVHKINGHTTYDSHKSHPMRHPRGTYKTQTLDLTNPNAHWEDR